MRILAPTTGQLLREHRRTRRGHHRVATADRPSRTPATTTALLARAHGAGPAIGALCAQLHATDGPVAVRRILGILALARTHGPAVVEEAARAALEWGVPTYRFLRRYVERVAAPAVTLTQVDPLIRQLTAYRDLIAHRTETPS